MRAANRTVANRAYRRILGNRVSSVGVLGRLEFTAGPVVRSHFVNYRGTWQHLLVRDGGVRPCGGRGRPPSATSPSGPRRHDFGKGGDAESD